MAGNDPGLLKSQATIVLGVELLEKARGALVEAWQQLPATYLQPNMPKEHLHEISRAPTKNRGVA